MHNIDLISPSQVMARLDLPSTTLYRWINEGRFPRPIKIGKRKTAFRVKEIEEWLNQHSEESKKQQQDIEI
jgi:prophage regulatory protein